ncbi:uncharacterized mitochondrial protein AtMg00810-like [Malus domestica]|uniref:uncharacterized mitochondrial protein AtMg00810-like n=1 Tax=Malus domestica TaxID=3750 RepID=UPI0039764653
MMQTFKVDMMHKYEMFDSSLLHHFLGMNIIQTESSIFIHQRKYAASLLNKFGLQNCKVVSIPLVRSDKLRNDDDSGATDETQNRKIVGSLLYLTAIIPYLVYVASLLARFMHCLTNKHFGTTKRILKYVQGTLDFGLEYENGKGYVLIGYYND